jgi:hypothetical protein
MQPNLIQDNCLGIQMRHATKLDSRQLFGIATKLDSSQLFGDSNEKCNQT